MFAPQANTNNVVNKPTIGQTMNLYPNPAQTEFTIEVANSLIGSDLVVYGYDGKQAATFKIQSTKQQIDISNLPAGSYWTVATSALGTVTRTFTKL
jgi:DNA-binding beta-propeller fold protein YncE